MNTPLEAEHAKKKLVEQIGHHPAVNGVGFTRDKQANTILTVRVLQDTDQTGLDIPNTVNSIPVQVVEIDTPEAY